MKNPIENIDFTELRNQKRTLIDSIAVIEAVCSKMAESGDPVEDQEEKINHLTGILHMIDSIQDYAVDELGWDANLVYDFEMEEGRDD